MPPYNSPVRLEKLSLQTIGTFVSELGVRLVKSAHSSCLPASQIRRHLRDMLQHAASSSSSRHLPQAQQVCRQLRQTLLAMVPYYLVNAVTLELLKQLDNRLEEVRSLVEQPCCRRIVHEVVKAVLLPKVTELFITWRWKLISEFVILEMGKLSGLKSFKLPVNVEFIEKAKTSSMELAVREQLHSLSNLQTFVFHHYCTDDTIRTLCDSCSLLKCLDIYLSNTVSDASVEHIMKLKQLQELDVTETDISDEGRVRLLTGLSQNGAKLLRSYRTYSVTNPELRALSTHFPDLREFGASLIREDLSVRDFGRFHNLEVCHIYSYGEFMYSDVFEYVGSRLLKLSFVGPSVNITDIIKNCPNLKSLVIKADHLRMDRVHLPGLFCLRHLTLRTRDSPGATALLCQCQHLTSLQLCAQQMFFFAFLKDVMMKNKLASLRHLCVGSLNENVPPDAVAFLTQYSANLLTCRVFGGQDAELRALYQQHPGVQVDPDLWIQLADNVGFANKGRKTEIVKTIVNYMYEFRSPYCFQNN